MQITLSSPPVFKQKEPYYTEEEQRLLEQLENGSVKSIAHEQVMANLCRQLKLDEVRLPH